MKYPRQNCEKNRRKNKIAKKYWTKQRNKKTKLQKKIISYINTSEKIAKKIITGDVVLTELPLMRWLDCGLNVVWLGIEVVRPIKNIEYLVGYENCGEYY